MKLKINGKEETIEKDTVTVSELLTLKEVKMPEMVTVELNGDILDREQFSSQAVAENDEIEFLYFMGGGQIGI